MSSAAFCLSGLLLRGCPVLFSEGIICAFISRLYLLPGYLIYCMNGLTPLKQRHLLRNQEEYQVKYNYLKFPSPDEAAIAMQQILSFELIPSGLADYF
jgi:hypothetical protein